MQKIKRWIRQILGLEARTQSKGRPTTSAPYGPMRSTVQLAHGGRITPDYKELDPTTGQQKDYVVLTPEERAKGFVRPVRRAYQHRTCGKVTRMSLPIAETYARNPRFYGTTFCVGCRDHRPTDEFVWQGTQLQVGS